jgi:hypothetical protein
MKSARGFLVLLSCGLIAAGLSSLTVLEAQPNRFQFIVSATDQSGTPVTDLTAEEVVMTENGAAARIVKVEPYGIPVKLTIAVDNGPDSREAVAHYRTGLTGLVEALPPDVEVTLITITPPRMVVRPTTNREQILRGVNGFGPAQENPRFTDALVEYSQRLERELRDKKGTPDSLPIFVMVSTTAQEAFNYQGPEVEKALNFLATRKARLVVAIAQMRPGIRGGDIESSRQAIIAAPATKATRGRYETMSSSSRLATLLPEFGEQIADLHAQHVNQFRVTVERANNLTGPFQNLQIQLTRQGLRGGVSSDGLP